MKKETNQIKTELKSKTLSKVSIGMALVGLLLILAGIIGSWL